MQPIRNTDNGGNKFKGREQRIMEGNGSQCKEDNGSQCKEDEEEVKRKKKGKMTEKAK